MITTDRGLEKKLGRVSELAERVAGRVLAEVMQQRPVDDQTVTALSKAVLLLDEYGHAVPPLALDFLTRFFQDCAPDRRRAGPIEEARHL